MRGTLRWKVCQAGVVFSLWLALPVPVAAVVFPLRWEWANPAPHGNNIIDIASNGQLWVQVAERGQIFTSTNLITWTPAESHTRRALRSVTFFNDAILITGENGTIVTGSSPGDLRFLDLGTSDWLEGVAASSALAVAVGDNGAIYTSPDAVNWQRQQVPFNDWLRSVGFGIPGGGGTFVAVGEAGFVATSVDGVRWTRQPRFTSEDLNHVSWFSGEFWAVGNGGAAFQSSSGTTWLPADSGATNTLNAFTGLDSTRVIAGEFEVRLRAGRNPWSNEMDTAKPFPPPAWTYLSATTATNSVLLCGRTGMMAEGLLSTNDVTVWFPLSDSLWNWLWDVERFPNLYLAVGDRATILSSSDAFAWEAELPPDGATNSIFLGIGGRTNLAVVVGNAGTIITSRDERETVVSTNSSGTLVTNEVSTLGIVWQAVQPRPTAEDLQGVAVLNGLFVVSGGAGTILTSPDAVTWTKQATPTASFLSSVEAFPGGLVAVGKGGTILTSPDAINWTRQDSQTTNWIYRVRYLGDRLVAVGENGTLMTSSDGSRWQFQKSGTHWLNDVQWIGGTYFAIGNQGTVLSSPDATQWTDQGTITGKSLFGAASQAGQLVVVGVEGVILRSQVVPIDPTVNILKYPMRPDQNEFLFSGSPGQQFSLDRSVDINTWTVGPLLQINSSGTLPFTDIQTNSPLRQFFRATPKP